MIGFSGTTTSGQWLTLGTITLEKGVYIMSAWYDYKANATGVRIGYLYPDKSWRAHNMYVLTNATSGSNQTRFLVSGVIEVLETTNVAVRAHQTSGGELDVTATVDYVKLA